MKRWICPPTDALFVQIVSCLRVFRRNLGKHSDTCYMTCTAYSPWFDHRTNIWWSVQFMELFIIQFSPTSYYIPILVPHILFGSLFWNANRMFFRYSNIKSFTPHRAVSRLVLCSWMFTFWTGGVMSLYVGQHFESNVTVPVRFVTNYGLWRLATAVKCSGTVQTARHVLSHYINRWEMLMLVTAFFLWLFQTRLCQTSRDHSVG